MSIGENRDFYLGLKLLFSQTPNIAGDLLALAGLLAYYRNCRMATQARPAMTYSKRGGVWWVRWRDPGDPANEIEEETPLAATEPLEVVRAYFARRAGGEGMDAGPITAGVAAGSTGATVGDLPGLLEADYKIQERRTLPRALAVLRRFVAAVGAEVPLVEVSTVRLVEWVAVRVGEISHGTVRTELQIIRRAFSLARLYGKISTVPAFPKVKASPCRKGFLGPEELQGILDRLPPAARALVEFLAWTGWRVNETRKLQWAAVDWKEGEIRLEADQTKEAAPRVFPFKELPQLEAILRAARDRVSTLEKLHQRVIPWVFATRDGACLGYDALKYQWAKAKLGAGLPAKLIHDLRRSAAKLLSAAGVPVQVQMSLLGHKTLSMWRRYGIPTDAACREGVRKLSEHLRRGSQGGA